MSQPFSTTRRRTHDGAATHPDGDAANASAFSSNPASAGSPKTTHFGFETVTETEKTERVAGVFTSVADSYDRMNDLMSFGWHRVWKNHFVASLNPGLTADANAAPQQILDVAGGTGDIAFRLLNRAHVVNRNPDTHVTISDINAAMLAVGRERSHTQLPASQQAALSFLEADATSFRRPDGSATVATASIDLYTVAFGIRNFTDIPAALREAYRVLRPGGVFACLEFSKIAATDTNPAAALFDAAYQRWSFSAIPMIGQLVAGDRDSYQYLVESIQRFPSQDEFRDMIVDAGFVCGGCGYENLTGGIAAIHKGMKPLNG
ncbi:ubiquinone biosynthesis methyltransferase coq5 [Niveomyces insectorum RCEF 264]|uniref:2-methoxy-6-polyprenyl-1,4-benzoquinol methylase, mitochondrial n=1 Tax=Niveomyces insectorum RCEF 264 TaxID=1081102 RepID=A0A167TDU3_9HYPO|nr:ubiquinone biosynthesis methyltransferase coq5 [Niveomyces insectorum RCEF 264]